MDQHMGRFDVFVDQTPGVQPAERSRQTDGQAQERCQFQRTSQQSIERLAARVGKYEHRPPAMRHEHERLGGPPGIEFGP
jgi:hypothetical protein